MAGEVVAALREELGAEVVLTGEDVPERNRNDWSAPAARTPLAVVRPSHAGRGGDRARPLPCGTACRWCRRAG